MHKTGIISRYLLREILLYAGIGVLAVGALLVLQNALRLLQQLIAMGITPGEAAQALAILALRFSTYAAPIAFLFGVMLGVGRMAADAELRAMQALGVSFGKIIMPIAAAGLCVALLTGWLLHSVEPGARRDLLELVGRIAARGGMITPGAFTQLDSQGRRILFVDAREGAQLTGVLIFDGSQPQRPFTVTARRGTFALNPETLHGHLRLQRGALHLEGALQSERTQRISFARFHYRFDMREFFGGDLVRLIPRDMTTAQLRATLAHFAAHGAAPAGARETRREVYAAQLHRRWALPFAPLLFALVGAPLAARRGRSARALGALGCCLLVFAYYVLLSAATDLAHSRALPAWLALWLPNIALASVAVWLLWRAPRAESGGGIIGRMFGRTFARAFNYAALPSGFVLARGRGTFVAAPNNSLQNWRAQGLLTRGGLDALWARAQPGARGRGATVVLPPQFAGAPQLLLRRLRHGGWLGALFGARFVSPARPLMELQVTNALHRAGAPVAAALLVAGARRGLFWRLVFGTEYVRDAIDAQRFFAARPSRNNVLAACAALGRAVRKLHDAGGMHPDLHLKNLLLRPAADGGAGAGDYDAWVIDFDRAPLPAFGALPAARRMKELMRLYRSVLKRGLHAPVNGDGVRINARALAAFWRAYCAGDRNLRRALLRYKGRELFRIAMHRLTWPWHTWKH